MEQVKLPQIKVKLNQLWDFPSNDEKQWIQVNPSCLLAYLGIRGYASPRNSGDIAVSKNALPILTYFDIFKNYYANTQEENFYMIGTSPKLTININGIIVNNPDDIIESQGSINPTSTIKISTTGISKDNVRLIVKQNIHGRTTVMTPEELGDATVTGNDLTIKTTNIPTGGTWFVRSIYSTKRTALEVHPLDNLEIIRDKILLTPGDVEFDVANESMSIPPFTDFAKDQLKKS